MPPIAIFALNIGSALLMGMAIGLEQQFGQHQAGLRTNTLVCLGAALFVSLPTLIDRESRPTRVAGPVVSGLGFMNEMVSRLSIEPSVSAVSWERVR